MESFDPLVNPPPCARLCDPKKTSFFILFHLYHVSNAMICQVSYDVTQSNDDASYTLNNDINYNNAFFLDLPFFYLSQITLKYHEFHFQSVSHHNCIFIEDSLRSINAHDFIMEQPEVFTFVFCINYFYTCIKL